MKASVPGVPTVHLARPHESFPYFSISSDFVPTVQSAGPMTKYLIRYSRVSLLHHTTWIASPILPTSRVAWAPAVLSVVP